MFFPTPPPPSTPRVEQVARQHADVVSDWIAEQLRRGVPPQRLREELQKHGHSPETAAAMVNQVNQPPPTAEVPPGSLYDELRQAGQKNMAIGGVICAIGLVVTCGSLAASGMGGAVIIAWGAIVFGAIQFFRGMSQTYGGQ